MISYIRRDADRIRAHVGAEKQTSPDLDALFLIYAVLLRSKGTAVAPADVHDAWAAWAEMRGVDSPCLVPFEELDGTTRLADQPYVDAIRAVAAD